MYVAFQNHAWVSLFTHIYNIFENQWLVITLGRCEIRPWRG